MKPFFRGKGLLVSLPILLLFCAQAILAQGSPSVSSGRERLSLDRGWLFHEGDIPFPVVIGHQPSYDNAKAGSSSGAASPEYDDSSWKQVDLPHDWAVEQPFDPKANVSQGYRARGMGWYRKYFRLDPADNGKHLEVQLDAVSTHCTVWINGVLSARNWTGYTSIYIDITPIARYGREVNTIAVQVDANAQEGWWYEGAGLYRHAWLVKRNPVHIVTDGVFANPVRNADGNWSIPIEATLYSSDKTTAPVEVESTLIDPSGKALLSGHAQVTVEPLNQSVAKFVLAVQSPKLWSVDEPTLYSVRTVVKRDGEVVDEVITHAGFRTIRFDPNQGFFLNDKPLKLLGTANHQDHAGVGVAVPDALWDFRIRRLKEMGSNAYRAAHNAPAAEFLDACDRLGMLVMDENRNFGASPEHLKQLDWEIRRDRNHPSIILWSVFNEEPSQGTEMGYELVRRMSAAVKDLDTTRPVTAAQSNSVLNPVNASQAADVAGFNYVYRDFDRYHELNPSKPMFSSEDTSTVMTRDEYVTDLEQCLLDSYDDQVLPWGLTHRDAWKQVATRPFVAGTMVWTGFDYRGEPQPLSWPAAGSSFGIMDLCGFPKAAYYIHQAQWIQDRPLVHIVPHWNWAGSEGKPIKVMVTSNLEKVELRLNGKPVGEKRPSTSMRWRPSRCPTSRASWKPWPARRQRSRALRGGNNRRPGGIAAGSRSHQPGGRWRRRAAGHRRGGRCARAGGAHGGPIGEICAERTGSDHRARTTVTPRTMNRRKEDQHTVFHGLAQIIVQSGLDGQGKLTLTATSDGLTSGETAIDRTPAVARPAVPVMSNPPLVVLNWIRSPVTAERPDPNQPIGNSDMNSWGNAHPGGG